MNIFILSENPVKAAELQCDKHVVKMIVESAQMLSTAHRMLDGVMTRRASKSGKMQIKYYALDDSRETSLYKAVHFNHPCTIWVRESKENYRWLYKHLVGLVEQYHYRYNKTHKTETILSDLLSPPNNIPNIGLTPYKKAMNVYPDLMAMSDTVSAYREYYRRKKNDFNMVWTSVAVPLWFT